MKPWATVEDSPVNGLPVPKPSELSRPHWDACARGLLWVQRCDACQAYQFPPEVVCTSCFSDRMSWVESSGRGAIYSYTVVHRPQRPEFTAPYVVVIVALEEGWHMLSNLIDCDPLPASIAIGDPVEVCFVPRGEIVMPMFRRC